MGITRTIMVDDDGSGQTGTVLNNAWLQTIYNQIDGVAGSVPATWTPIDASGAGLTFGSPSGRSVQIGASIFFYVHLTFPANSNGAQAQIGGLPVAAAGINGGGYTTFGIFNHLHVAIGATKMLLYNPTGAARTNAEMSGSTWVAAGQYLV
jgi:hypothetical protein